MSEDLGTEEVANGVEQITRDIPTKERKLIQYQDCRNITLISHPSKVMGASEQDGVQLIRSSTA